MDGKLFSQDFLLDGIKTTPIWEALPDDALNIFIADLKHIYSPLTADSEHNEANTESQVIEKVLDLLGWNGLALKQVTATPARRRTRYCATFPASRLPPTARIEHWHRRHELKPDD